MPRLLDAAGGEEGVQRLARAWHERVLADEVVGHAFRHGVHPHHTERLAAYWTEALAVLHDWFSWVTRTSLARFPRSPDDVPDGLSIPRWGWDGLEESASAA